MSIKKPVYEIKGDLVLQSKHADIALWTDNGASDERIMFFFNTPKKGKCLSIEYNPANFPAFMIIIQANWKSRKRIAYLRKPDNAWEEGTF